MPACAGSSVVEQEPFKLVVVGSIPTQRTIKHPNDLRMFYLVLSAKIRWQFSLILHI